MEEGEERILNVVTINAHTYREGEEVNVSISEGMGIKAVKTIVQHIHDGVAVDG